MAQQHRENIWRDHFMAELENEDVNRQLCAVDTFSWSPGTQEQILAEWDDWQEPTAEKSGNCCIECGKVFARPDSLKRHMKRVHTSEKSFPCERCEKSFATSDTLKRHEKSHSERGHECARCHKKFDRKDNLSRHMKMHERRGAEREYTCNVCGEVFRNIFPFQTHRREVHQVGRGKRTKTPTGRTKRQRTDEPEPPSSSTRVNEGASTVVNE
ncbi:Zinc finger 271 (Zinc finger 7) (HZF7) (Zinc finger ZNFphex133) (Epstein-Barr virus-induced zinc finger, partial [Paramuricea clavata]